MNRRDWLKMLAAAAPVSMLYSGLEPLAADDTYLIVTDDPDRLATSIVTGLRRRAYVETRRVAPSRQDLTIVRSGTVVDPQVASGVDSRVRELLAELRRRTEPGTYLVTIQPHPVPASREVRFEQDGRTVESLDRRKSYREVVIPGPQGPTVFSLEDGSLRVVRSSCRHELCRRSGAVRSGRIVCVPNRLVASIDGPARMYDAITG